MTTLIKITVSAILALLMTSCNFDMNWVGVKGNGNVITKERTLNGTFNEIKISRGLDVYLTQSATESIEVQADENLHDIIITKIEGNVLKIYADENISYSSAQKVMVNFENISRISATSGSDVFSTNLITVKDLELKVTSGSDMELEINTKTVDCKSTSGADLKLSGSTNQLFAESTSGSDIDAGDLIANTCNAKATSGSEIIVNAKEKLYASTSSGADITYYGKPNKLEKSEGVSSKISKR